MSVLYDMRQELRAFLARDERGEMDVATRRAFINATIMDLQDFEVQLTNAQAVLMARTQSAHDESKEGEYVPGDGDRVSGDCVSGDSYIRKAMRFGVNREQGYGVSGANSRPPDVSVSADDIKSQVG